MFAVLPQKANNFFIDLLTKVIDDNINTIFKNNPKLTNNSKIVLAILAIISKFT